MFMIPLTRLTSEIGTKSLFRSVGNSHIGPDFFRSLISSGSFSSSSSKTYSVSAETSDVSNAVKNLFPKSFQEEADSALLQGKTDPEGVLKQFSSYRLYREKGGESFSRNVLCRLAEEYPEVVSDYIRSLDLPDSVITPVLLRLVEKKPKWVAEHLMCYRGVSDIDRVVFALAKEDPESVVSEFYSWSQIRIGKPEMRHVLDLLILKDPALTSKFLKNHAGNPRLQNEVLPKLRILAEKIPGIVAKDLPEYPLLSMSDRSDIVKKLLQIDPASVGEHLASYTWFDTLWCRCLGGLSLKEVILQLTASDPKRVAKDLSTYRSRLSGQEFNEVFCKLAETRSDLISESLLAACHVDLITLWKTGFLHRENYISVIRSRIFPVV